MSPRLFVVRLVRQSGASMFAWMTGRIEHADHPAVRWAGLEPLAAPEYLHSMQAALARWHDEGTLPAVRVVLHRMRVHPVDSSVYAFNRALSGLVCELVGREGRLRPGEVRLMAAPDVPPMLRDLLDAGHTAQAIELLRASGDAAGLAAVLQEAAQTWPDERFLGALFDADAAQASAALQALIDAEAPALREALQSPRDRVWEEQRRKRALAKLSAPLACDRAGALATLDALRAAVAAAGTRRDLKAALLAHQGSTL